MAKEKQRNELAENEVQTNLYLNTSDPIASQEAIERCDAIRYECVQRLPIKAASPAANPANVCIHLWVYRVDYIVFNSQCF